MLSMKVEYLTGVCAATKHSDPSRTTPEWPPHPDRLYSALVAAAANLPDSQDGRLPKRGVQALEWLAAQNSAGGRITGPALHVSDASSRFAPEVHLPENPHEDEIWSKPARGEVRALKKDFNVRRFLPIHRKRTALPIPACIPFEPAVYFIWPDADPKDHIETLREICERVTYLGRSRSLVRVTIVNEPPCPTLLPSILGQIELRVPGPGRLEELDRCYNLRGGKPEPSVTQRYARTFEQPSGEQVVGSIFHRMYIFRPQPGAPTLPIECTEKITRLLRSAVISSIERSQRLRGLEPNVPAVVHGHRRNPHCAYVALPYVSEWQRHADGSIKGLAILTPRDVGDADLLLLASGLEQLQETALRIPGIGEWRLAEVAADSPPIRSVDERSWRKSARIWTTVTPMVFGHFPKRRESGHLKVVLDSLRMIGIDPELALEVAVDRHSPLHGAQPSWKFIGQATRSLDQRPPCVIQHVTVRFQHAVTGPIILGAKRYFGLGLMQPLEDQ